MSWSFFDVATLNAKAKGFFGAGFDGRYLYFVPRADKNSVYHGNLARLDTTGAFGLAASWEVFDLASVNAFAAGFNGAAFDGRYLYLGPSKGGTSGLVFRFDAKTPPSIPPCYNGSYF